MHWIWNSKVQALRWRYSRENASIEEVYDITEELVREVLNYSNPEADITQMIQENIRKFSWRVEAYLNVGKDNPVEYEIIMIKPEEAYSLSEEVINNPQKRVSKKCKIEINNAIKRAINDWRKEAFVRIEYKQYFRDSVTEEKVITDYLKWLWYKKIRIGRMISGYNYRDFHFSF